MLTHKQRLISFITGLFLASASFATIQNNASSCISAATAAAGTWRDMVESAYIDDDKANVTFSKVTFSTQGFTFGSHDSADYQGLVYAAFGPDGSPNGNYVATMYLGSECGAASDSKLLCLLKKDASQFRTDTGTVPDVSNGDAAGFWMDCTLYWDVHISSGTEADVTDPIDFSEHILESRANAIDSALENVMTHGVTLSLTSTEWTTPSAATTTVY